MIANSFEYLVPTSVEETISMLKEHAPDAKILAGGMSLIPILKLRLASPSHIIDINRLSGLDYVRIEGGRVLIGALTRHHTIETSSTLKETIPLLAETASWIGDPQVRNMGTIGGSLAHSDPFGDWGAAITALRGKVRVKGPTGERVLEIDDFLVDTFTSALEPAELITEVEVGIPGPRSGSAYMKLERKAGDVPTVAVAAQLTVDSDDVCTYVGIGLAGLGPKSLRASKAESALLGNKITSGLVEEASRAVATESQPGSDLLRGSAEYKRRMAEVFARRALIRANKRAVGGP